MIKISRYFIPYVIFLVIIGYRGQIAITFIIVFCHELIHYLFARYYKISGFDIEFIAVGTVIKLKDLDEADKMEDIIISSSAPLFNIIFSIISYALYRKLNMDIFYMLFSINLIIGIFNLIPAFPLDGGRIFRDILNFKVDYRKANRIMIVISIIIGSILMLIYMINFLKEKSVFNIGIIGLFIVVSSLREKERASYIIMGDIIKKKYKFIKRGYIENRNVSIHYKQDLLTAMGLFDKNKYNVFMVLDDTMNILDIIYEEQIIEGLKVYGNMSLEKFMKYKNSP
ncbi:stage IV sporulation protein FB [Clostridium algifaecis]|uniref:Stage IV sporulation protein FB n=1 Tax=Clostridium algifaecis TaxID=1472040 RepID=A0ABS4KSJ4_9CLOT|nr:M50 family metallopeptidase [Clostridium algifaecis]MBP2033000.1 stage IV sporulation protein FB [Clostridium algifaecis]